MIRNASAVVLGIVAAVAIVAAVEAIGHSVYPVPPDVDVNDPVQFQNYVASLPFGAFLFVLASWNFGAFGGGLLAVFIARHKPFIYATIVGAFVLVASVANLIMVPHPLWFSVTAVISISVMTTVTGLIASSLFSASNN